MTVDPIQPTESVSVQDDCRRMSHNVGGTRYDPVVGGW